jgi:hypothetical protein
LIGCLRESCRTDEEKYKECRSTKHHLLIVAPQQGAENGRGTLLAVFLVTSAKMKSGRPNVVDEDLAIRSRPNLRG